MAQSHLQDMHRYRDVEQGSSRFDVAQLQVIFKARLKARLASLPPTPAQASNFKSSSWMNAGPLIMSLLSSYPSNIRSPPAHSRHL